MALQESGNLRSAEDPDPSSERRQLRGDLQGGVPGQWLEGDPWKSVSGVRLLTCVGNCLARGRSLNEEDAPMVFLGDTVPKRVS